MTSKVLKGPRLPMCSGQGCKGPLQAIWPLDKCKGVMHRGEIHIFPEIAERDRTPPGSTHELVPKVIYNYP